MNFVKNEEIEHTNSSFLSKDDAYSSKKIKKKTNVFDLEIISESMDLFNNTVEDFEIDLSSSIENKINLSREDVLQKEITPQLFNAIRDEDFDFGFISNSEKIIRKQLNINALATRNWLNELFVDYFNDELILTGILRIIGRFEEHYIFPQGQTMALAALNHKTTEIKELGIRAFENWSSINSIKILECVDTDVAWLEKYRKQVISDLKEEVCI